MSALEIPNAIHAAGTFAPIFGASGQFRSPIPSSVGFQPFDPAGTPVAPKGGFTAFSVGNYAMQLLEGIDVLECLMVTSIFEPFTSPVVVQECGAIPSVAPFNAQSDFVGVGCIDPTTGDSKDVQVYQSMVLRYATGPKFADETVP